MSAPACATTWFLPSWRTASSVGSSDPAHLASRGMWSRRALLQAGPFRSRQGSTDDRRTPAMAKKLKHKDTGDTDTQTTQAQSTDDQGAEAQATEDRSRGEQARPYLKNASYPAHREDLAASAQQQGADQDVAALIVLLPDEEYAAVER